MGTNNIKTRLANEIQKRQFDLTTLSKQLGISQRQLENYISGKTLPRLDVFANICKILDLDINQIIVKS